MPKKSNTPEQVINKLRQAEILLNQGESVAKVCRKIEVTGQTFYRWRKEYGGMRVDQAKRLKELELENIRLKKLVADLSLGWYSFMVDLCLKHYISKGYQGATKDKQPKITVGKAYNTPNGIRCLEKTMPRFEIFQWQDFQIKLIPYDDTRNLIRNLLLRRDFISYFNGKIKFDLGIVIPRDKGKLLKNEQIKYEWFFCRSQDDVVVNSGSGVMPLTWGKVFNYRTAKANEVYHYGFEFSKVWFSHKVFRQRQAIDLRYVSKLDRYKIDMKFTDKFGHVSERTLMLEFTLLDYDLHTMNVIYLLIGAFIGLIFAAIGGVIGFFLNGVIH